MLVLTFMALHGQDPINILDLLKPLCPSRTLMSSNQMLLVEPQTRRTCGAFQVVALKLWNALPLSLFCSDSIDSIKHL